MIDVRKFWPKGWFDHWRGYVVAGALGVAAVLTLFACGVWLAGLAHAWLHGWWPV